MTHPEFENTLRAYMRQRPFLPFVIKLNDGRRITVEEPAVAYNGGAAAYITEEDGIVDFSFDEVESMAALQVELQS